MVGVVAWGMQDGDADEACWVNCRFAFGSAVVSIVSRMICFRKLLSVSVNIGDSKPRPLPPSSLSFLPKRDEATHHSDATPRSRTACWAG